MDKITVDITGPGSAGDDLSLQGPIKAHTLQRNYEVIDPQPTDTAHAMGVATLVKGDPSSTQLTPAEPRASLSVPIASTRRESMVGRQAIKATIDKIPSALDKPPLPKEPRPVRKPDFVQFTQKEIAAPRDNVLAEILKETEKAERQLADFTQTYPKQQLSFGQRSSFKEEQATTGVLKECEAELVKLVEQQKSDKNSVLSRRIKSLEAKVNDLRAKCQQIHQKKAEMAEAGKELAQSVLDPAEKQKVQLRIDTAKKAIDELSRAVLSQSAEVQEASDKIENLNSKLSGLNFLSSPREYVKLKLALREWTARKASAMSAPLTAWEREERRLKDAVSEADSPVKRRDAEAALMGFRQRGPHLQFMAKMQRETYTTCASTRPKTGLESVKEKVEVTRAEVGYRARVSSRQHQLSMLHLEQSKLRLKEAELEGEELRLYNVASDIAKNSSFSPVEKSQRIERLFQQHWSQFKGLKRELALNERERAKIAAAVGKGLSDEQREMMFAGTESVKEEWRPERAGEGLFRGVVHTERLDTIVKGRIERALKVIRLLPDLYQSAKLAEARAMGGAEGERLVALYTAYPGLATATFLAEQWNRPTILREFLAAELEKSEKEIPSLERQVQTLSTDPKEKAKLNVVRSHLAEARSKLRMIKPELTRACLSEHAAASTQRKGLDQQLIHLRAQKVKLERQNSSKRDLQKEMDGQQARMEKAKESILAKINSATAEQADVSTRLHMLNGLLDRVSDDAVITAEVQKGKVPKGAIRSGYVRRQLSALQELRKKTPDVENTPKQQAIVKNLEGLRKQISSAEWDELLKDPDIGPLAKNYEAIRAQLTAKPNS